MDLDGGILDTVLERHVIQIEHHYAAPYFPVCAPRPTHQKGVAVRDVAIEHCFKLCLLHSLSPALERYFVFAVRPAVQLLVVLTRRGLTLLFKPRRQAPGASATNGFQLSIRPNNEWRWKLAVQVNASYPHRRHRLVVAARVAPLFKRRVSNWVNF